MKKIAQAFLALAAFVVLSTFARAAWDSTLGNMPSTYELCWGLNYNACIYGSTVSNFVRIQTGGIDALTVNSSQVVGIPGALAVTGAITTGAGGLNASGGPTSLQIQTTTQLALDAYPVGTLTLIEESTGTGGSYPSFVTNVYNACLTTSTNAGAGQTNSFYFVASTVTGSVSVGGACNK